MLHNGIGCQHNQPPQDRTDDNAIAIVDADIGSDALLYAYEFI
jgi:hypothetical protein